MRAGTLGLPMALAIIGGMPERFAPLADLYRESALEAGHDLAKLALSINSHGFIADESKQAADDYFPSFSVMMNKIGRERGWSGITRQQFDASRTLCAPSSCWAPRLRWWFGQRLRAVWPRRSL